MNKTIKFLTMNIGNPSIERAEKQVDWLQKRHEDILFLTETKNSSGCNQIANSFCCDANMVPPDQLKRHVSFPKSVTGDYGVMCISKYPIISSCSPFMDTDQYHCRYLENDIIISGSVFRTVCLYVPSRDQSYEKIKRKRKFLEQTLHHIAEFGNRPTIICGDLNIVDRTHMPHYSAFKEWEYKFYDDLIDMGFVDVFRYCYPQKNEYSWVGRTGNGYRYDYCFVSGTLSDQIIDCKYIHQTRKDQLTDHSALMVELKIT